MIWGGVSSWIDKQQDHQHEIARMELQGRMDAEQHARNLESLRVQSELGIKTIQVQSEADAAKLELEGWAGAVKDAMRPTGITWVDAWNGIIRPMAATISIALWVIALNASGWHMTEWDKELVGVVLGFFFASRVLAKNGK